MVKTGAGNLIVFGVILLVFGIFLVTPIADILGVISLFIGGILTVLGVVVRFFSGQGGKSSY